MQASTHKASTTHPGQLVSKQSPESHGATGEGGASGRLQAHGAHTSTGGVGELRGVGGGSLGTYGKSDSAGQDKRRARYVLQSAARLIRRGFPVSRCLRWTVPNRHAEVMYARDHGKAFYAGLETCGSVWECPVCAAKISERRRAEVLAAMTAHKAAGGQVLLLTLTNPHHYGDDLRQLLDGQARALRGFWSTRAARRLLDSIGCVGSIRALEVTDGTKRQSNNGWHPHYHILLFVRAGLDLARLRRDFFVLWSNGCHLAGMEPPSFQHGVSLEDGSFAEKYVSKWGLENEMTKGHIKQGKDKGRTPFDLLRDYAQGDKQAGALFVEYANAFKGKRQLFWSRGLKAHFAIEEATDQELAEREEENAEQGCTLSREDWALVLSHDCRAEILEAYEIGGRFEVAHCLAILRGDDDPPVTDTETSPNLAGLAEWMGWTPDRLAEFVQEVLCV